MSACARLARLKLNASSFVVSSFGNLFLRRGVFEHRRSREFGPDQAPECKCRVPNFRLLGDMSWLVSVIRARGDQSRA